MNILKAAFLKNVKHVPKPLLLRVHTASPDHCNTQIIYQASPEPCVKLLYYCILLMDAHRQLMFNIVEGDRKVKIMIVCASEFGKTFSLQKASLCYPTTRITTIRKQATINYTLFGASVPDKCVQCSLLQKVCFVIRVSYHSITTV